MREGFVTEEVKQEVAITFLSERGRGQGSEPMPLKCMGTLSGEVTLSFTYLLLFSKGFNLKGKNLLLLEQILSFKSKPHIGMAMSVREANRKSQKLFRLIKWRFTHNAFPLSQ